MSGGVAIDDQKLPVNSRRDRNRRSQKRQRPVSGVDGDRLDLVNSPPAAKACPINTRPP